MNGSPIVFFFFFNNLCPLAEIRQMNVLFGKKMAVCYAN